MKYIMMTSLLVSILGCQDLKETENSNVQISTKPRISMLEPLTQDLVDPLNCNDEYIIGSKIEEDIVRIYKMESIYKIQEITVSLTHEELITEASLVKNTPNISAPNENLVLFADYSDKLVLNRKEWVKRKVELYLYESTSDGVIQGDLIRKTNDRFGYLIESELNVITFNKCRYIKG